MSSTTPREQLVATVALMQSLVLIRDTAEPWLPGQDERMRVAEAFVAGLEAEPEKPVACPCCEKQVVMCSKHYLLHEPGKKCTQCWDES